MVKKYIVADAIADFLVEKNINVAFAIIGSFNAYILDSINKRGYTKLVFMHHEQCCTMAASSYFKTSGKIAAVIVTAGAGAANCITGIITNWADSTPCLVISGQESIEQINKSKSLRMIGTQGFDAQKVITPIVKVSERVCNENELLEKLDYCYYNATSGRYGPVFIEIPFDLQSKEIIYNQLIRYNPDKQNNFDSIPLNDIKKQLEHACRPVILFGHGVKLSESQSLLNEVINKLKIPTISSWLGIDVFEHTHPYYFGRPGLYGQRCANFILQNCDLLIVIGNRLSLPQTGYNINNFAPNAYIIRIENDINEINKYRETIELNILTDCNLFLKELLSIDLANQFNEWNERCNRYKIDFPLVEPHHIKDQESFDNSYVTVDKISTFVKEGANIIFGQGTPLASGHQAFKTKKDQKIVCSNGFGEMGNGLPSAIGAYFARPDRQTVCLMADGSMMMNLQELQTIIGYQIPLKIILFNNEGYLFIKHTQKMLLNSVYTGVDNKTGVTFPNFKKVSEAFGFKYFSSKETSLEKFLNEDGACLYETFMNPEQDLSPKVKGVKTINGILAPPLEEMSPLLDLESIKNNMIQVNDLSYKLQRYE
jgi:acetolactate synthase-1/2/3 large subunit